MIKEVVKVDNSPTQIGYVSAMHCLECDQPYNLDDLIRNSGTIFHNGPPQTDDACFCGAPLDIRYDLDRVREVLTPAEVERRYDGGRNFHLLGELLPFNNAIVGNDMPFSPLKRAEIGRAACREWV